MQFPPYIGAVLRWAGQLPLPFVSTPPSCATDDEATLIRTNASIERRIREGDSESVEKGIAITAADKIEEACNDADVDTSTGRFVVVIDLIDTLKYESMVLNTGVIAGAVQKRLTGVSDQVYRAFAVIRSRGSVIIVHAEPVEDD